MKVLHISYSYDFKDGGITTVVEQLVREQRKTKINLIAIPQKQLGDHFSQYSSNYELANL